MDKHGAVKIGDLEKNSETIKAVKPNFNKEIYQNAAIWEVVGELAFRGGEEGSLRSCNVGASRWEPPLEDEDSHNICQATYKGVEGAEWEKCVLQVRGDEQGSQRPSSKWKQRRGGKSEMPKTGVTRIMTNVRRPHNRGRVEPPNC